MMKRVGLLIVIFALVGLAVANPRLGAIIGLIASVGVLALWSRRRSSLVPIEAPGGEKLQDIRVQRAITVAMEELASHDVPASRSFDGLEFDGPEGHVRVEVGYFGDAPFAIVRMDVGDESEFACIVRRRISPIGLPPVVENTPVGADIEYRLRDMPLGADIASIFAVATNRPRLVRELLAAGFEEDLRDAAHNSTHRLEDMGYGGRVLSVTVQPAVDPSTSPWLIDVLGFAETFVARLRGFLAEATIPNAQE